MALGTRIRIGDRLIELKLLTLEQLQVALSEQRRAYRPLGEILVSLGFVKEEDITALIAEDMCLPFLRAADIHPEAHILAALEASFVLENKAFPYALEAGTLKVVMVSPDDPEKVSAIRASFPYPVDVAITTDNDIRTLVRTHLRSEDSRVATILAEAAKANRRYEEYPVEQITHALILDGIQRGATDIHLEPDERVTRVRYRVDGILRSGENVPAEITSAIISRVKILAGLDISERRRPQDGRIRMSMDSLVPQRAAGPDRRRAAERHGDQQVDLRISIMPSADGENIVIRILGSGSGGLEMANLGVVKAVRDDLVRIVNRSHGLFLVTGPTGSGKTTTLYSLLKQVDAMKRNVCTIEDPIEYKVPLLRQSQVDNSIGFGFQEGLRALLRQDPDVILVGEIRDRETADMAIKASMTGHLVFSTLHTNSAIGAIPRLIDIGVASFLIEDTLVGVLGQRLVRRVCSGCAIPHPPDDGLKAWLGGDFGVPRIGQGCARCEATGYSGRTVICELFLPSVEVIAALRKGADQRELARISRASGFRTMTDDGKDRVRAGFTTREEVERVSCGQYLEDDGQ